MAMNTELGQQIADAADQEDVVIIESLLRGNELIVLQQTTDENGEPLEEEGDLSVVLAELDDEVAVISFTDIHFAEKFTEVFADKMEEDSPQIVVTGDSLMDGLPNECGLLVNPGSEQECFFPPGTFATTE